MRESAGLTQSELAKSVGVSQSYIAKIEKGSVDPRLSIVRRIMDELSPLIEIPEIALSLMHSPVISVKTDARLKDIADIMEVNNISQVPVITSEGKLIGMIYDFILLRKLSLPSSRHFKAIDLMGPLPPLVDPKTSVTQIMKLLTKHSVTIVVEKDLIPLGIITRSDLIKYLSRK